LGCGSLEHLHWCSVCDPAMELLDEVHQSSESTGKAEKSPQPSETWRSSGRV